MGSASPFFLTICSGKGGVGKSVLAANIAYYLSISGKKVLLWDADMFFPNQHIIHGVEPPVSLFEVYLGNVSLENAEFQLNQNLFLLSDAPAAGKHEIMKPSMLHDVYLKIKESNNYDLVIIDTMSAASNVVIQSCSFADIITVIINDEPTSLLDAYGLIKILIQYFDREKIRLIVNNVIDAEDAEEFSNKLNLATEKFLETNLENFGFVPYSRSVRQSILKQELFMIKEPESDISSAIKLVGNKLMNYVNTNIAQIF